MAIETTSIDGLLIAAWPTFTDDRGFFRQTVQTQEIAAALGREPRIVQMNHARSQPRVLRGFHAEPWDKVVYAVRGTVMLAVADIRPDSPTFATAETILLGDTPGRRVHVFVAEGLANAYAVVGDAEADVVYGVSEPWHDVDKRAIAWDDPDLAVIWPTDEPILSDADRHNPSLRERFANHPRFASPTA
ncbi:MAG: dTDP-4-dehydrorhamnose 3,5-epimerase family protein [Nitriliruptoraceae bacterium]